MRISRELAKRSLRLALIAANGAVLTRLHQRCLEEEQSLCGRPPREVTAMDLPSALQAHLWRGVWVTGTLQQAIRRCVELQAGSRHLRSLALRLAKISDEFSLKDDFPLLGSSDTATIQQPIAAIVRQFAEVSWRDMVGAIRQRVAVQELLLSSAIFSCKFAMFAQSAASWNFQVGVGRGVEAARDVLSHLAQASEFAKIAEDPLQFDLSAANLEGTDRSPQLSMFVTPDPITGDSSNSTISLIQALEADVDCAFAEPLPIPQGQERFHQLVTERHVELLSAATKRLDTLAAIRALRERIAGRD